MHSWPVSPAYVPDTHEHSPMPMPGWVMRHSECVTYSEQGQHRGRVGSQHVEPMIFSENIFFIIGCINTYVTYSI